ncbi:hypothetical protein C8J56DRAFT_1027537 [Mycena floridula]|nr:hypothetical protein C8J56DRAFT_1027537 [Mycena floridula]
MSLAKFGSARTPTDACIHHSKLFFQTRVSGLSALSGTVDAWDQAPSKGLSLALITGLAKQLQRAMDWVPIPQGSLSLCTQCDDVLSLPHRTTLHPSSRLLDATYSPNDDELRKAFNCILEADRDIGELDTGIARLTRILERVKSQRDLRVRDKDMFRALINPIRRIPNEIWRKIFPSAFQGTEADFGLLQVCRHWRAFLLSSPQIFDRVQLDLTDSQLDPERYTWLVLEYSSRLHAGEAISRLDIVFPDAWRYKSLEYGSQASSDLIASLNSQLQYTATRSWWQSISHIRLLDYSPDPWDQVFDPLVAAPKSLEELVILLQPINHHHYGEWGTEWDNLMLCFDHCLGLRHVTTPDAFLNASLLDTVHITDSDEATAFNILAMNQNSLTSFAFQYSYKTAGNRERGLRKLPQLQHLTVEASYNYCVDYFLRHTACPSLVSLHLSGILEWKSVHDFLNRSGCALQTLSVGASSQSSNRENLDSGLLEILRSNPTIRHLTYFEPSRAIHRSPRYPGYPMSNILLRQLFFSSSSHLLPELETLMTHCSSSQLDSILAMGESRMSILRYLGIDLLESEPVDDELVIRFSESAMTMQDFDMKVKNLRRQGLSVYRVKSPLGRLTLHG